MANEQFLDNLSKHLLESACNDRKRIANPKLIAEARAWYKDFVGTNAAPMSDVEVVEIYNLLQTEVDK